MLWSLFVLLGVLLIWDLSIAPFTKDAMLMKFVAIAPSAVLSHLSLIFLGWLFVVRWGLPGIPFLLLSVV